jgi:hypothetical protein
LSKKLKPFTGFGQGLFHFLNNLSQNNNTNWFHQNKEGYQKNLVEPARSFISERRPFINRLNPAIRTEPMFNKTIMRLNKDMRFNKGEPYRTYFLLHFGKFKMDSEFFVYFSKDELQIGLFINNSKKNEFHFNRNSKRFSIEIIKSFNEFNLNSKFSLYELNDGPQLVLKNFNAEKHFETLRNYRHLLLQKAKPPNKFKIYKPEFVIEAANIFTSLYPIYIFATSENPIKDLEKFRSDFL